MSHKAPIYSITAGQPLQGEHGLLGMTLDLIEIQPSVRQLIKVIHEARHNGRPGFPPVVMWRACCLKYLLNMRYTSEFIDRLKSSPKLQRLCGFKGKIPSESTFSRFFALLASKGDVFDKITSELVACLQPHLPGFGQDLAVDSTDLEAYANPKRNTPRDPDAAWGRRTIKAKSAPAGSTESFFGYKLHSLTDAKYGVPLVHLVTPGNVADTTQLIPLTDRMRDMHRIKPQRLMADKGYDSSSNHEYLLVDRYITPIIPIRKTRAKDGLYDGRFGKDGTPMCGKTRMKYVSTDLTNGHHLFQCPRKNCGNQALIEPFDNLRVVGMIHRASPRWKSLYKLRSGVERMFGSQKQSRLLDKHQFLKQAKIEVHVALASLTYTATMLARAFAGQFDQLRRMRL